jgi:hypothetical protein
VLQPLKYASLSLLIRAFCSSRPRSLSRFSFTLTTSRCARAMGTLCALRSARFPHHCRVRRAENAADESYDGAREEERGWGEGYIVTRKKRRAAKLPAPFAPFVGRVSRRKSVFACMCPRLRGFYGYSRANIPRAPPNRRFDKISRGENPRGFLDEHADPRTNELNLGR